jgi:hypothetical protein
MARKKTSSVFKKILTFQNRLTAFNTYNTQIRLVIFGLVITDILLIKKSYDSLIFSIIIVYIITIAYSSRDRITFFFCLILLFIMTAFFVVLGTEAATEKAAVWLFLFLAIGIIEQWRKK